MFFSNCICMCVEKYLISLCVFLIIALSVSVFDAPNYESNEIDRFEFSISTIHWFYIIWSVDSCRERCARRLTRPVSAHWRGVSSAISPISWYFNSWSTTLVDWRRFHFKWRPLYFEEMRLTLENDFIILHTVLTSVLPARHPLALVHSLTIDDLYKLVVEDLASF